MVKEHDSPLTRWLSSKETDAVNNAARAKRNANGPHCGKAERAFHDIYLAREEVIMRVAGMQLSGVEYLRCELEKLKDSKPCWDVAYDNEKYPDNFQAAIRDLLDELDRAFNE